jgi:hypothetical protein
MVILRIKDRDVPFIKSCEYQTKDIVGTVVTQENIDIEKKFFSDSDKMFFVTQKETEKYYTKLTR